VKNFLGGALVAIIWQFVDETTRYEVRSAGSSIRLYTNGAFHTQYSPKKLFTGGVWDLLSLPALFTKLTPSPSVLMLGVGGGSAIHQLLRLLSPREILGIELNPVHIEIAESFFNLKSKNLKLLEADALKWIDKSQKQYDVLVDDLFIDSSDDPIRPFKCDEKWIRKLNRRVTKNGLLIQNHLTKDDALASASMSKRHFQSALMFTTLRYENVITAFYKQKVEARTGRFAALRTIEGIDRKSLRNLQFKVQKIF
jgi:predicted membrane-bound spermidine synthase